jgi:hypothetical protein
MTEEAESTAPVSTEAQQVLDLLRDFQKEINAMHSKLELLDTKVNKEMPSFIDAALTELKQNDNGLLQAIQTLNARITNPAQTTVGAAAQGQSQGGVRGILDQVMNAIAKRVEGGASASVEGGLTSMQKEILHTSERIELEIVKSTLRKVQKEAGISVVEHVVVSE